MTLSRLRSSALLAAAIALTGAAALAQSPAPAAPTMPAPAPATAPAAGPPAAAATPPAATAGASADPAGLVASVCTSCHGMTVISAKGRSPADWDEVVGHMVDYGAMASDSDLAAIKAYLAKTYPAAP